MFSSGTTAIATSGAGNVTLITMPGLGAICNRLIVINEGANAGFVSRDGGSTWDRIPAAASATSPAILTFMGRFTRSVLMKRDGGSDMAGVYASADWVENQ